jgi:hypothetical protein
MTTQLLVFGVLGVLTTAYAVWANRWLFGERGAGRVGAIEAAYYVAGVVSVCIGWYFNVRYTHHVGSQASYVDYTKALFANFAADSAAQDYIMVNVVLLPLWTVVDGRRRGIRAPWIFFVVSLFTSLAFAMAFYLAMVERQERVRRLAAPSVAPTTAGRAPDRTATTT